MYRFCMHLGKQGVGHVIFYLTLKFDTELAFQNFSVVPPSVLLHIPFLSLTPFVRLTSLADVFKW